MPPSDYSKYKETDLGLIPNDWEVSTLRELSNSITVGFVGSMSHLFTTEGVPLLRGTNITPEKLDLRNLRYIPRRVHLKWKKSELLPGNIVMVRVGYPGTAAVIPHSLGEANAASLVISRPNFRRLNSDYAVQAINSPAGQTRIQAALVGGAQQVFNTTLAARLLLAVPPRAEQDKIAKVLSDADDLIASLDRLVTKKRAIRLGLIQQLFTGKTRLLGFTSPWREVRLGDILTVRHGKSQKTVEKPAGRFPILASGGRIGWTDTPLYTKPSVLIGRKGTIDRPQYQSTPFWSVDTLFYTEISPSVDPRYLYNLFTTINWGSMNEASGVPSLSSSRIESVDVSIPHLEEQIAIRSVIDDIDSDISALKLRLEKARHMKIGLMQQLLSGRLRLLAFEGLA